MRDSAPDRERVEFGAVVRLNRETSKSPTTDGLERYVGLEHIEPGDLRIRSWGDVAAGTTFTNRFRPGHVLFGKRRAYQRKVAVADFEGVCSGDIYVLESKDSTLLLPELLPFICRTDAFFEHAVGTSAGSLSPRTNWKSLAGHRFALPPLDEQRHIARLAGAALRCCDELRAARLCAHRLRRSALEHLLDATSQGWPTATLGELVPVTSGGTPNRSTPEFWGGPIPWVKTGEVAYRVINTTEESITEAGLAGSSAKLCPPGTVVMALYGQGPTRGRVAILGVPAATNQACALIPPNDAFRPKLLFYFLWRQYERIRAMAQGAAQPNLSLKLLKAVEVPVLPLEEQDELLVVLEMVNRGCHDLEAREVAALRLLQSITNTHLGG